MNETHQQATLDQVKAGRTVFRKQGGQWLIVGPADKIQLHTNVRVTKTDGTITTVSVARVFGTKTAQGVEYAIAEPGKTQTEREAGRRHDGYRTVNDSVYGRGRRYNTQRGATQYDDGSGTYRVQIWDES